MKTILNLVSVTLVLFMLTMTACGAGGGSDDTASADTTTDVTQCGDINVSLQDAQDVVDAANDAGVPVEDNSAVTEPDPVTTPVENSGGFGQTTPLEPVAKVSGVTIVACGGTLVSDDSVHTSTSVSQVKRGILEGTISSIEVRS